MGSEKTMEVALVEWLELDFQRMAALELASQAGLRDWCLAAGFVRNLVWDRLHGYRDPTPLDDIDLVHFDPENLSQERDRAVETRLREVSGMPWSVKNQARMHLRNADTPYVSTRDAMSYWVEVETAVGVRLSAMGQEPQVVGRQDLEIVAPFGLAPLFAGTITRNLRKPGSDAFRARLASKAWLTKWPKLIVNHEGC